MTERPESRWRLDRSINAGDILVFLSLLAAGFGYVLHQDQRSTRTEEALGAIKEVNKRQDDELQDLRANTDRKLDRLDSKMDRLIEQHMHTGTR